MQTDALLAELNQFATLKGVLGWAMAQEPRAEFVDVVIQDEYHHDLIVRVTDSVFAVFETSWLGAVMAVAIWNHRPTPNELLDRRLAGGWRPTPTATVEGDIILGYAACSSGRLDVRGLGDAVPQCELPG
jgi:hypothetical protein